MINVKTMISGTQNSGTISIKKKFILTKPKTHTQFRQ